MDKELLEVIEEVLLDCCEPGSSNGDRIRVQTITTGLF